MKRPGMPKDVLGMRFGTRVVIAELRRDPGEHRKVRLMCDCGRVAEAALSNAYRSRSCASCSQKTRRRWSGDLRPRQEREPATPVAVLMREANARCPEVWLCQDPDARDIITEAVADLVALLGPMSLSEVGELFGISRERVRQVQAAALRKLKPRCILAGLAVPPPRRATMAERVELMAGQWGEGAA